MRVVVCWDHQILVIHRIHVNILKIMDSVRIYTGGDLVVMNQMDVGELLEIRFPGFRSKEQVDFEGLSAIIISHEHSVEKYPCYMYGYQIGDDVSHIFHTRLLLLPPSGKQGAWGGFVLVRIDGYSNYSERYDQESVSVTCELGTGQNIALADRFYYEKYPMQDRDTKKPRTPLLNYMRQIGFTDLSEEFLAKWLTNMRSRFSY
jgi:hypothetical protein